MHLQMAQTKKGLQSTNTAAKATGTDQAIIDKH